MRPVWRALASATLPYLHYQASPPSFARAAHSTASGAGGRESGGAGAGCPTPSSAAAAEALSAPSGTCLIGYVTDIEGNRAYFDEYVRISRVVDRDAQSDQLELRDGCELVFGGDVCDKGDGDLYVARELVGLKRRYPGRVHIILGNRDVNKMRFAHELARSQPQPAPGANVDGEGEGSRCVAWWTDVRPLARDDAARCRWMLAHTMGSAVPDAFELRRQELARQQAAQQQRAAQAAKAAAAAQEAPAAVVDDGSARVLSLGAMLSSLFGTGGKPAGRQQEATLEEGARGAQPPPQPAASSSPPSDADVVRSFRESVLPGGAMLELLAAGQVGALLGDCLFVHGALSERSVGLVPPSHGQVAPRDKSGGGFERAGSLGEWVARLNAFAAQEVASFCQFPAGEPGLRAWAEEGGYGGRGGEGLVQYGMGAIPLPPAEEAQPAAEGKRRPRAQYNPSVIYASWFDGGRPKLPPPSVFGFVAQAGVTAIFTGHQPIGDTPAVMRAGSAAAAAAEAKGDAPGAGAADCVIVCADTSYSNNVKWVQPPPSAQPGAPPDPAEAVPMEPLPGDGQVAGQVVGGGGNRGLAVSEVLIEMDSRMRHAAEPAAARSLVGPGGIRPTVLRVHGILSDGR